MVRTDVCLTSAMIVLWLCTSCLNAAYVLPRMGGGQVSQGVASMKHADIAFDGQAISVHLDTSVGIPVLRALEEPDEFDPATPAGILGTKAYNYQYGWNPGGFLTVPNGTWIWIEQLDVTPGLEVYQRPPASPAYAPIFGTDGSALRWRWGGQMTHNVYAVQDPQEDVYEAWYRVYIGADATGEPVPGYEGGEVRFTFSATPRRPGDFDVDGVYDCEDINLISEQILSGRYDELFDLNLDQKVDVEDFAAWLVEAGSRAGEITNGNPFLPADGNLDGRVDAEDFSIWDDARFSSSTSWCLGDYSMDGVVDVRDFDVWNRWKGAASVAMTLPVPEPTQPLLGWGLLVSSIWFRGRRAWGRQSATAHSD